MADSPEAIHKQIKLYLIVFGALLVLTVVTWAISYVDMGHTMNLVVGLAIAALKASLVAGVFMHLFHEKKLVYRVLIFTFVFFLAMMFLCILAFYDPIKQIF